MICLPIALAAVGLATGTAARAIDALDPAFVATRLKDLLDRLGSSPASVDRLHLGMWYCIACRQADDADLARDLRHWMIVVRYTGREDMLVGEILGPMGLPSANDQAAPR